VNKLVSSNATLTLELSVWRGSIEHWHF